MSCNETLLIIVILATCLIPNSICGPIPDSTGEGKPDQTKITKHSPEEEPIIYKFGNRTSNHDKVETLSCSAKSGTPVVWHWLRNGKPVGLPTFPFDEIDLADQSTEIYLHPERDVENNYTCIAVSSFGNDSYTFITLKENQQGEENSTSETSIAGNDFDNDRYTFTIHKESQQGKKNGTKEMSIAAGNDFRNASYTFTIRKEGNWTREISKGVSIILGVLVPA